jgi:ferric-dicitrate binding protein FerR (iron transport regulator)
VVVAKALSLRSLCALGPRDAAAYFVARRSEGLTPRDQRLLEEWLKADTSHAAAFASAETAWQIFEGVGDDRVLMAIRAEAMATRPRKGLRWRPTTLAAAILVMIVTLLLAAALWLPIAGS